jgi:hypothetical protein
MPTQGLKLSGLQAMCISFPPESCYQDRRRLELGFCRDTKGVISASRLGGYDYLVPACFLRASQRAFIKADNFSLRPSSFVGALQPS